jgi:hypothetical protein
MKTAIFIFLFISSAQPLYAQNGTTDTAKTALIRSIYGTRYWGNVIHETQDSVFLLQDDGIIDDIPRNLIDTIEDGMRKPKDQFAEAGFIFGTPAGSNLLLGYEWWIAGIRASGFYSGSNLNGVQLNLLCKILRGDYSSHYLSLIWATMHSPNFYLKGPGAAYDLNISGFSFELGIIPSTYAPVNLNPIYQIGYVYQFR